MHEATAQIIASIGKVYLIMGQRDRAIEHFERALCIQMTTTGEMHHTADIICSIGQACNDMAQYDRAIEQMERALRIQISTLGEMHDETAISNLP